MNDEMHKILVAEDSPVNRALIKAVFSKRADVQIVMAQTGEQVLEIAQDQQFELVLLDVHMPDMSVCDVTQRLRGEGIATPILVMTADAPAATRQACLEAGCTEFIAKPIGPNELVSIVQRHVPLAEDPEVPVDCRG